MGTVTASRQWTPALVFAYLAIALGAVGCAGSPSAPSPPDDFLSVSQSVTIGGKPLNMTAYAYRNFGPSLGQSDDPLRIVLTLKTADDSSVPPAIAIETMSAQSNGNTWTQPTLRRVDPGSGQVQVVAEGGPLWSVGADVRVIVRIRSENNSAWLRAPDVQVQKVF